MAQRYSLSEMGARVDDWQNACRAILPTETLRLVEEHIRAKCRERNLAESRRGSVSSRSACHCPLHNDDWSYR